MLTTPSPLRSIPTTPTDPLRDMAYFAIAIWRAPCEMLDKVFGAAAKLPDGTTPFEL